ncbi:HalOD1 output domain-containing protein [Natrarchaeobius chitinivorans]|uniref:Halobacterial output domain-containing protein n=1 Tax=Natrarchaeobius chitinivorans TaxID=1679083 RepID=A0A3N6LKU3_NATCH|nr:HalOD1 output domain-containing protein [Natrarchaeobius chitinivorans]RQG89493.1 hypothetical protein EA473_21935 [Natrarchaeobius chitinivorans]
MPTPTESTPHSLDGDVYVRIVETIASKEGCDATELPPIHDVIDPTALEQLFRPTGTSERPEGTVAFRYCDYRVTVTAGGRISVE